MTAPKADRGFVQPWAPHHAPLRTRRDLDSFSAGSPFKRSEPLQTFIDCLAMLAGFLLVSFTGVGIAFAMFVLLFVRIP